MNGVACVIAAGASDANTGELEDILQEVSRLRVQLERCISSNDRLRATLRRSGTVAASADDGSAQQLDGQPQCLCGRCLSETFDVLLILYLVVVSCMGRVLSSICVCLSVFFHTISQN